MSTHPSEIKITMDLHTLGELAAHIAHSFADHRGIEIDASDFPVIAEAAWEHVKFMHDRAEFARSAAADIAALEEVPVTPVTRLPVPDEYERRMQGPS